MKNFFKEITVFEYCLWGASVLAIVLSNVLCGITDWSDWLNWVSLVASLLGVTSLIFIAKGNVIGNVLVVIFAVLYGIVSYFSAYYGEMISCLGMLAPTAAASIISWLRHPFQGKKTQVAVNRLSKKEFGLSFLLACGVAAAFYFILGALNNANLVWSTVSILTSFYASYLIIRRSPFYAVAYEVNDIVLIVLWSLAVTENPEALSMIVCFATFLANDIYGFISWQRRQRKQARAKAEEAQSEPTEAVQAQAVWEARPQEEGQKEE